MLPILTINGNLLYLMSTSCRCQPHLQYTFRYIQYTFSNSQINVWLSKYYTLTKLTDKTNHHGKLTVFWEVDIEQMIIQHYIIHMVVWEVAGNLGWSGAQMAPLAELPFKQRPNTWTGVGQTARRRFAFLPFCSSLNKSHELRRVLANLRNGRESEAAGA